MSDNVTYKLLLANHVCGEDTLCYQVIGRNYDTRQQAQNAKRSYSFERSGVVDYAKKLAKEFHLRSPWKIEQE